MDNDRAEAPFSVEDVMNSIIYQGKFGLYKDASGVPLLLTQDGWVHCLGGPIVQAWSPRSRIK